MRENNVRRIRLEHSWCGRVRPNTKLRLLYYIKFGDESQKNHCVEVIASMRTGKREVRFDKMTALAASKQRGGGHSPLPFEFNVVGHVLRVEESCGKNAGEYRFALRIDGKRFNELPADADVENDESLESLERRLGQEVSEARAEHSYAISTGTYDRDDQALQNSAVSVVAENALVQLYQVQLEPGVFGAGVSLRNEPWASRRIQVAAIAKSASVPGVSVGDVLVAINGKPLPRGASATELQELVRSNPRYALTAVDALMWHKKIIMVDQSTTNSDTIKENYDENQASENQGEKQNDDDWDWDWEDDRVRSGDDSGLAGSELTINCGNGALGVEWARLVAPKNKGQYIDGLFAAVGIRGQALNLAVKPGDILVGIGHEPLPRDLPSATLLQRFSSAAARGPPTLNLWRCYDPSVLQIILNQCAAAKKHALAVNPSVSAHLPRRPRSDAKNTNGLCC
uniref:PDZ domain-containing protein n=1 Tax=Aureoumbra lagunensis TaxID=44058 RepID=A0A7S3JRH0_9STRA